MSNPDLDTRQKMRLAKLGKPLTINHRKNMSYSNKGKKKSITHRKNIGISNTGKKRPKTTEWCENQSKIMTGSGNSNFKGPFVASWGIFESMKEAADFGKISYDCIRSRSYKKPEEYYFLNFKKKDAK